MKNLIFVFFFVTLCSTTAFSSDNDSTNKSTTCVTYGDIYKLQNHFQQLRKFHNPNKPSWTCASHLNKKWKALVQSLKAIKSISTEQNKAMKYPISNGNQNWWELFTQHADSFVFNSSCEFETTIAYVKLRLEGLIYLCPPFWKQNTYLKAAILLHEAWHFIGPVHTTCLKGEEIHKEGGCDDRFFDNGSYSVSFKALSGFLKFAPLTDSERFKINYELLYLFFNKFNYPPLIPMNKYILLSNDKGELIQFDLKTKKTTLLQKRLPKSTQLSTNKSLIFVHNHVKPTSTSVFEKLSMEGIITKTTAHTNLVTMFSDDFITHGKFGALWNNTLYHHSCNDPDELTSINLNSLGNFLHLMTLGKPNDLYQHTYTVIVEDQTKEIFSLSCKDKLLQIEKLPFFMDNTLYEDLAESFYIDGKQYGLLWSKGLVELEFLKGVKLQHNNASEPLLEGAFLSATPFFYPKDLL